MNVPIANTTALLSYIEMAGSEDTKKAAEALKRENERLEEERKKKDKEIAELLKKIKNT